MASCTRPSFISVLMGYFLPPVLWSLYVRLLNFQKKRCQNMEDRGLWYGDWASQIGAMMLNR